MGRHVHEKGIAAQPLREQHLAKRREALIALGEAAISSPT
jgi:hypothetical protein